MGDRTGRGWCRELRGGGGGEEVEGGGVKFPSGFQLGRINSVLELTLTPSLPLLPGPAHRPSYSPSQQGMEKGRDCITATLSGTKVAENGTIKSESRQRQRESGEVGGVKLSRGRQKPRTWETRSKSERSEPEETPAGVVVLVWTGREETGRGAPESVHGADMTSVFLSSTTLGRTGLERKKPAVRCRARLPCTQPV